MIFLLLSYFWGKEIPSSIFFPKIWSYSLVGKWKMIFLKKYMEIWYFLQMFWKNSLFKKIVLEYDLSRIVRKDDIFFSRKHIFYIDGKWKMIFLKKYMEMMFSVYSEKAILLFPKNMKLPLCKKSKDGLLPEKYTQIWPFQHHWKRLYSSWNKWYWYSRLTF